MSMALGLAWLRGKIGGLLAFLARVPWYFWVIGALGVVLVLSRLDLGRTREREATLATWQTTVIDHASRAFGETKNGKVELYAKQDIPLVLDGAGIALRMWKEAVAKQNAAIDAAVIKGQAATKESRDAAAEFDAGKTPGRTPAQLRDIKPAARPDTAAQEAVDLGREEWSGLR